MAIILRPDKYVHLNIKGDLVLHLGETIRFNHKGIEIMDRYPDDAGTLVVTNFRIFWYSATTPGRNVSIGFEKVIAVGKRRLYAGKTDETEVLCVLTFDFQWMKEFLLKNYVNTEVPCHVKNFLDTFRSYTSTKPFREVLRNAHIIRKRALKALQFEEVCEIVQRVRHVNKCVETPYGTFVITNLRCVWFADDNEKNNLSLPFLCVERVHVISTELGNTLVVEVIGEYSLLEWRFKTEPQDKQDLLLENLRSQLLKFKESPIVGF